MELSSFRRTTATSQLFTRRLHFQKLGCFPIHLLTYVFAPLARQASFSFQKLGRFPKQCLPLFCSCLRRGSPNFSFPNAWMLSSTNFDVILFAPPATRPKLFISQAWVLSNAFQDLSFFAPPARQHKPFISKSLGAFQYNC